MFYVARATHGGGFPAGTHLGLWRLSHISTWHPPSLCPSSRAPGLRLLHLVPQRSWERYLSLPFPRSSPGPPRPPPPGPAESRREGPRRQPFPAGLSPARKYDSCIIFSPLEARRLHSHEEKTHTLSSTPRSIIRLFAFSIKIEYSWLNPAQRLLGFVFFISKSYVLDFAIKWSLFILS